jgi:predicted nucleic acid-binding protein
MSVIANTTVISNFASIRYLDLLRQLFGVLSISTEVYEEIQAGIEEGYQFYMGTKPSLDPLRKGTLDAEKARVRKDQTL